jgi:hypothetical protein
VLVITAGKQGSTHRHPTQEPLQYQHAALGWGMMLAGLTVNLQTSLGQSCKQNGLQSTHSWWGI